MIALRPVASLRRPRIDDFLEVYDINARMCRLFGVEFDSRGAIDFVEFCLWRSVQRTTSVVRPRRRGGGPPDDLNAQNRGSGSFRGAPESASVSPRTVHRAAGIFKPPKQQLIVAGQTGYHAVR